VTPKRSAHYLWALLVARIYEVLPLLCPLCGGQMRITPARGTPLWDECDVQMGNGVDVESDWDDAPQPTPEFEFDQRISW
jgi:hypothetical protein